MTKLRGKGYCWWVGCGLIFVGMIIVGVIVLGGSLGIYWFTPLLKPLPSVRIIQPDQTLEIESGQAVVLVARGESINGINYINFLVNDIPLDQEISSQPKQETLEAVFPWFSSQPGIHKLSVVAYDNLGSASSSDSVLVVVNPKSLTGVSQPDSQGTDENNQQPSGGSNAAEEQAVLDQILQNLDEADDNPPGGFQGVLDLVLQNGDEAEDFPVDRPGQPQDAPPEITIFDIQTTRDGNQVSGTYHVDAVDDLGLAYLTFNFASLDDPFHPISNQHTCGGARTCAVDGHFQLPQGGWVLSSQAVDTSGQVSPTRARQVHVLAGPQPPAIALDLGGLNLQLDPQVSWDDIAGFFQEPGDDIGTPRFVGFTCDRKANIIEVPYTYLSDHGDQVFVGAFARSESDNSIVGAGHMPIETRSGIAKFEIENLAQEPVRTDQLELHFRGSGADYFYEEIADLTMVWPVPKPDLAISSSSMDGESLTVDVQNLGCRSVEGFNLSLQGQEGATLIRFIDHLLPAGGSYTWWNPEPFGANLFSRGYTVTVDPDNAIEEINEDNNVYEQAPITNKGVQFYYLDIHSTSESWPQDTDQGEFSFDFSVGNSYFWTGFDWILTPGPHDISIILYPTLEWNQDLYIEVNGIEQDFIDSDNVGQVKFTHPYDIHQEYTWKKNGEICKLSDKKVYTICWRWVVE